MLDISFSHIQSFVELIPIENSKLNHIFIRRYIVNPICVVALHHTEVQVINTRHYLLPKGLCGCIMQSNITSEGRLLVLCITLLTAENIRG